MALKGDGGVIVAIFTINVAVNVVTAFAGFCCFQCLFLKSRAQAS